MSTLSHLQERLSSAISNGALKPHATTTETKPTTRAPERPQAQSDQTFSATPQPLRFSERLHRKWLGGGGFIVGVVMFAVGYAGGPLALAALLGFVALAIAVVELARKWRPTFVRVPALEATGNEHLHDRQWERDENASLLATVHDALGDIAVTRGLNRRIVRANATFRKLTGKMRPEGMTCEEIGLAFRPGMEPNCYDVELSTPEGQRIFVWHDVTSRDPTSGKLMMQSIAREVTAERIAARIREEARMKAEYSSAAKSRLLATVSHEIRTPLSGILGMSHLLTQTRMTLEQANYLTGIRQSGNALVQLVEDLLDFSTMEVGRFELHPRSESLRRLLESVVEMLAHRAHEKGIEIGATVSAEVPEPMDFDPARLRQVLFNIIGNAVKFTQTGGVFIRAGIEGGDLVITVRDSGPGMTEEEQARIFGEFEQAGSVIEKSEGTGLGLAISARIMQQFGGSMSVASTLGTGSEFTIRFPVHISEGNGEQNARGSMLKDTRVLLLAPPGAASTAISDTIRTLGGTCSLLEPGDGGSFAPELLDGGDKPTDVIVDHRMAPQYIREFADRLEKVAPGLRKIFLVNPEERSARPLDIFDAWLIRPLREQSLIDVLRGRMRGMEKREAINETPPGFDLSALPTVAAVTGLQVLLAEDDPVNAMLVRATLTKAGHHVHTVADFESVLDRAWATGESRPDIIVTDLSMPGGDGLDMLARLRTHERAIGSPPVPVIVLTADGREEIRRNAILNGANLVMAKPADPQRLINEVQTLAALTFKRIGHY
ncbi:hybrid sensor histidine kinase/response regulator [Rhizobium tubonense]|uniref:histidine kinase n=1 Tax=Rhizobium tubonense TaxID=484088 RepID=A0A2W4CGA2_9HYPH|nr:ATP-binding protein [Rhizobium tubonense]PZM12167.1 hybrid sensor histidine kinase/response regulator [Rhizobium tubonense]